MLFGTLLKKVINQTRLKAFVSTRAQVARLELNPIRAHIDGDDSFLFHGCAEGDVANIQSSGLLLRFAKDGMLGRGLYGAPDPRKAESYCRNSKNGKFMFVCRFHLSNAQRAGPDTSHRNRVFNEFCVYNEQHVVVLWVIKLK